ncbi:hypothetical protein PUN28_020302 [Cardiocondyla obscurior]|uniref:Uncharacterized protein n=1 Tax=Cardiocondyla obscurior TaxID=286306 RepID=A0AAW2E7I1_9HYME
MARINRHNALVTYIAKKMPRNGYDVTYEPILKTTIGNRKPDLMGILGRTALIIDAQVVSEQTELNQAHNKKVNYYNDPAVIQSIKETYNAACEDHLNNSILERHLELKVSDGTKTIRTNNNKRRKSAINQSINRRPSSLQDIQRHDSGAIQKRNRIIPTVPIYYLAKPLPRERAWKN